MIILTNAQGDVLNAIPDKVYQGSNLANQIVIVSPWSANLQVTIAYKLPNGDFTEPKLMTAFATNPLPENLQANAWSIDIDEPVTENFGVVEFQFKAYNGSQKIATGGCSFTVQHGVAPILPATPSQTIYEQILEAIGVLSSTIVAGDFESKALTPYDSTFEYSKYDVIADFQTYGGMYYSLTDNNKGNLPTDTTKWAILPYATLTQLSASIQAHNTSPTAHTDIRTEIANIVNGNTTIEKYQTKANLVTSWAETPTDNTYPSAKLVKTTLDDIKSEGSTNFVFATKQDFLDWIAGTITTDINGKTVEDLQIGANVFIQEYGETDYWCSSISDPLTINDFTPIKRTINLDNYLAKDNTSEYNPTGNYNPATKKYADDSGFNNISSLDLSHGEETITYDTTDGITVNGNARKTNTDSSTKDFDVEFNVPIVAGDNINIDATSDNKKVEIKYVPSSVQISGESGTLTQAQIGILSKPNAILGRTIDADHFVVYVNQGIIEKNYVNYLHYVSIPYIGTQLSETLNFEAIDINVNDAPNDDLGKWELITEMLPNLTTLLSYIDMSPATVEIFGTSGTLTDEQMTALTWGELTSSPLVENSQRNGTILVTSDNPVLPTNKFFYNSNDGTYAIYNSYITDGSSLTLKVIKLNTATGVNYGKWTLSTYILTDHGGIAVVITAPTTATNGTITADQLATLQANDNNYIFLNNEIYRLDDKQLTEGFLIYSHTGQDNSQTVLIKEISITISTLAWTLTKFQPQAVLTFDTTPTKNSTNPVTSNGIQQALVDNVGVSLQECTTYQQIVNLLNANHNIGYGNIGYVAANTGLRGLLPTIPFTSNYGSVRARIISQGGSAGTTAGLWALEFILTSDYDAGGDTQKPVWHLYVRNSIVSGTATLYVGEWG